jgi:SH3 domain-containing YSC84-like protein 1
MRKIAFTFAIAMAIPLLVQADGLGMQKQKQKINLQKEEISDQARFHRIIDQSAVVYKGIAKGPHGEVPPSVLNNARCVVVLPNVMTGALVIGGAKGQGLASCVDNNRVWSQPAPISLAQGSIGLQVGAKSTDLVLFFQTDAAVAALKRGNFELGSDISAVAGNFDNEVDTSTAGVVVFTRTEGLFAGASINGSKISSDVAELSSFYGKTVSYNDLLEGRELPDSSGYTIKFTNLLP